MNEQTSADTGTPSTDADEQAAPDTSLRNFTIGVLAASAVIIVLAYFLQSAAG